MKATLWIISWILFPITTGLYFIWPSKIFRNKMGKGWKKFWWILYAIVIFVNVAIKIFFCVAFIEMLNEESRPRIEESDKTATYTTREDFYKLTGVVFPELELVESLYYDDGGWPTNYWDEFMFVAKDGMNKDFYNRLKRACETDSTHWGYSEGSMFDSFYKGLRSHKVGEQKIYKYWIYPDSTPVDRSRGMCDRMVEIDGEKVLDWDGSFISIEICNDTVFLREGWLR